MSLGSQGSGNNPWERERKCVACPRSIIGGASFYCDNCRYQQFGAPQTSNFMPYNNPSVARASGLGGPQAAQASGSFSGGQPRPGGSHEAASMSNQLNQPGFGDEHSKGAHRYPPILSDNRSVGDRLRNPFSLVGQNVGDASLGQQHTVSANTSFGTSLATLGLLPSGGYTQNIALHPPVSDQCPQTQPSWPIFSAEESHLMRHFIQHLSPWFDTGDQSRRFALAVPQCAASSLVLKYAIFAFSAQHLSRLNPNYQQTSEGYRQMCQSVLLPIMQNSEAITDEAIMAAIVILRQLEELEAASLKNPGFPNHLSGIHALINRYNNDRPPTGTVRLAAFMVAVGQEVLDAFIAHRAPIQSLCNLVSSLEPTDDHDTWAVRMLFHCSNVLQLTYGYEYITREIYGARWLSLAEYTQKWLAARPSFFSPIYHDHPAEEPFPRTVYHTLAHLIAALHFHISIILLLISCPGISNPITERSVVRERDERVRYNVKMICGFALRHGIFPMGAIIASAVVVDCGKYFAGTSIREQEALLGVLKLTEERYGWPTTEARSSLRETWQRKIRN